MREIYVNGDSTLVGYYQSVLESAGYACFIRNETTRSFGVDVLGFSHTSIIDPVLCIVDDNAYEAALATLRQYHSPTDESLPDWNCQECKEAVPGSFELCWKCQATRSVH